MAKPLGMTKKFAFSGSSGPASGQYDARASALHVPGGLTVKVLVGDSNARVRKFSSLGESSPKLPRSSPSGSPFKEFDAVATPLHPVMMIGG
jgi:hypothetical protein